MAASKSTVHHLFFQLAGLVRHEFWLHGQRPEDYDFLADADTLTIQARKQEDDENCVMVCTEKMLAGDLHALATEFYKGLCAGGGTLVRKQRQQRRQAR